MTASGAALSLTGNSATTASVRWILEVFRDATALRFLPLPAVLLFVCIGRAINRNLYANMIFFRISTLFGSGNQLIQSNCVMDT
jgi:hypothetical protein